MTTSTNKVVILFGAGASAYSGPVEYRGKCRRCPPIGSGTSGLFSALLAEGGFAETLPHSIQDELIRDFESGMRALERMPSTWHCQLQRQIALHLASYKIKPGNSYLDLLSHPHMRSKEILYSTLNYDLLLDQALGHYGLNIEGSPKDSPSPQFVTLLKLHGASNVLFKVENYIHGVEILDSSFGNHSLIGNAGKLYLAKSFKEVQRWCNDRINEQFAPAVAQYVAEKTFLSHASAFKEIQDFWAMKVAAARAIVLIGVSYVPGDAHVWKPLFDSDAELFVVNPCFEGIENWGLKRGRKPKRITEFFSDVHTIQDQVEKVLSKTH